MKATLKLEDGREIAVEFIEESLKPIEKPVKKTGYERVKLIYYLANMIGEIDSLYDNSPHDDNLYKSGNYYSDKTVAENNARANVLKRKLLRFAVEHRKQKLDWDDTNIDKYTIGYGQDDHRLKVYSTRWARGFGEIYFDKKEIAEIAIEKFKDELIWYFTEYKDSL